VEDIVRSAYLSVIQRLLEMDPLEGELVATGGVVQHHPIFVELLAEAVGKDVLVPPMPQLTGAFGAGVLAMQEIKHRHGRHHGQAENAEA
jgi:activator of 2-hydroxyglutaryl-CoA dehydratase